MIVSRNMLMLTDMNYEKPCNTFLQCDNVYGKKCYIWIESIFFKDET